MHTYPLPSSFYPTAAGIAVAATYFVLFMGGIVIGSASIGQNGLLFLIQGCFDAVTIPPRMRTQPLKSYGLTTTLDLTSQVAV